MRTILTTATEQDPKPRIGLLMDTLAKEERWQRDRDTFVERAKQLGAEVLVESAERDDAKQLQQPEAMLAAGVQVLVVVPHSSEAAAQIVEAAKNLIPILFSDNFLTPAQVNGTAGSK